MEFTVGPIRVTKELILRKVSEEQLMEHYLGIPVKKGLFRSPLRHDNAPTASFFRSRNGALLFKDFGSNFCGDFISVVMELFNCSYAKALQIIGNDFNIIPRNDIEVNQPKLEYTGGTIKETSSAKIQVEIRDFQQYELDWWERYGITLDILNKFNVYSCKNVWLNDKLFHLEKSNQLLFGYYGGIKDGNELWRLYRPGNKSFKFVANWKSTQIQGGAQMPDKGELLVITKSLKDVMTFYSLGIIAIAPNSENLFLTEKQFEYVKDRFTDIICCYDNDLPGIKALIRIKRKYPNLKCTFLPRSCGAKDISDYYKLNGRESTLNLLQQANKRYYNGEKEIGIIQSK